MGQGTNRKIYPYRPVENLYVPGRLHLTTDGLDNRSKKSKSQVHVPSQYLRLRTVRAT